MVVRPRRLPGRGRHRHGPARAQPDRCCRPYSRACDAARAALAVGRSARDGSWAVRCTDRARGRRWPGTGRRHQRAAARRCLAAAGAASGRGVARAVGPADLRTTALTRPALAAAGVLPGSRPSGQRWSGCSAARTWTRAGLAARPGPRRGPGQREGRRHQQGRPAQHGTGARAERHGRSDPTAGRWPWARCSPRTVPRLRTRLISRLTGVRAQQNDGGWSARAR